MTVKELIEFLKTQDENMEVVIGTEEWCEIYSIKPDDNEGRQVACLVIN